MKRKRAIGERPGPRRHGIRLIYCVSEDVCRLLDESGCTINTFSPGEEREAVAALICESESHESEYCEDDDTLSGPADAGARMAPAGDASASGSNRRHGATVR